MNTWMYLKQNAWAGCWITCVVASLACDVEPARSTAEPEASEGEPDPEARGFSHEAGELASAHDAAQGSPRHIEVASGGGQLDAVVNPASDAATPEASTREPGPNRDANVTDPGTPPTFRLPRSGDPGRNEWVRVPAAEVRARCKLDPELLAEADRKLDAPYVVVRYGQLCHRYQVDGVEPVDMLSTTKTFGAVVAGRVAYETRDLPNTGAKTGPFGDLDRADHWLSSVPYNPEAHVAHVMGMVAQNKELSLGHRKMEYDFLGDVQIDTLSEMLNTAIAQDPARLGDDLEAFTQRFVLEPLGMRDSSWTYGWPDKLFAATWITTLLDMARVGLLVLHGGMWNGERLLDEGWVYRMTHPAFEDANTAYGYLVWLNASSNYHFGGIPVDGDWNGVQQVARLPGPCAPVSVHRTHPHDLSGAPDCNYEPPYSCEQEYDVGVWQAIGINGKVLQGHPGLDLVIAAENMAFLTFGSTAPSVLWDALRPAVIAADPRFMGDERTFCEAYGGNHYAPDLGS